MKTLFTLATIAAAVAVLHHLEDVPTPTPYDPTDNPAQRVREFLRGDRSTLDDADLFAPSVPDSLHKAAKNLID